MKFYNQKKYPHLLYKIGKKLDYDYYLANKERIDASDFGPYLEFKEGMEPLKTDATIDMAGCGLCCAAMVADRILPNVSLSIEDAIELSYASGGDSGIGTEYDFFAPAFAEKMGLQWKGTNSLEQVDKCLSTGGAVVAKVGGDRKDGHIGVFTHGWHYIYVVYKRADGKYAILDPSLVPGKYDEEGRKGLIEVDGDMIFSPADILAEETKLFDPGYYMFWR